MNVALREMHVVLLGPTHTVHNFLRLLPLARSCTPKAYVTLTISMQAWRLDQGDAWRSLARELSVRPLTIPCVLIAAAGLAGHAIPPNMVDAISSLKQVGVTLVLK